MRDKKRVSEELTSLLKEVNCLSWYICLSLIRNVSWCIQFPSLIACLIFFCLFACFASSTCSKNKHLSSELNAHGSLYLSESVLSFFFSLIHSQYNENLYPLLEKVMFPWPGFLAKFNCTMHRKRVTNLIGILS